MTCTGGDKAAFNIARVTHTLLCITLSLFSIALLRGETFSGRLLEEHSGNPIRGARVQVSATGSPHLTADLETGSDGVFRAPVEVQAGEYLAIFSKPNYAEATVQLRIPLQSPLTLGLVRFGTITGRVTDTQNRPVAGASIVAMAADGDGRLRRLPIVSHVNQNGEYRLYNLPPGRYAVAARFASMSGASVSGVYLFPNNSRPEILTIASGATFRSVDFILPPKVEVGISGRVRVQDPKKRSAVTLVLREQLALPAAMAVTDEGKFRLTGIPPGSYHLLAVAPVNGYAAFAVMLDDEPLFARTSVEIGGHNAGDIDVSPEPGRAVRMSLRSDPACPSAAPVVLDSVEDWGALLRKQLSLTAGQETTLKHLAPGPYRIEIPEQVGDCFGERDRVIDMRNVDAVQLEVFPGGSVEGRIEKVDRSAMVALTELRTPEPPAQFAVADGEGRFHFPNVRPGRYRISSTGTAQEIVVQSKAATQVVLPLLEKPR